MKNKKLISTLVAATVVLWGVIFYRIYLTMNEEEEVKAYKVTKKPIFFTAVNHINDTVQLRLNYRSPFSALNAHVDLDKEIKKPITALVAPVSLPQPEVAWGNIIYTGYIKNASSIQSSVIMLANGTEIMLTEGQTLNGVTLIKYAVDSVKVRYQNQIKHIKLR